MKKVQRMLNFYTYKRLFCANCYIIASNNLHNKLTIQNISNYVNLYV